MKILLLALVSFPLMAQVNPWKNVYTEAAWKERDSWQKPQELIEHLALAPGHHVADVGCHEGYMSFKLANVVGNQGKVYAVDVELGKLDKLREHMEQRDVKNILPVKGEYDNPKLAGNSLNAALILDTYHEMDEHEAVLKHIFEALVAGGRLVICEPIAPERRNITRSEQEAKHELAMRYAIQDLEKAGFKILTRKDPFTDRTHVKGDKMWLVVAQKP